jgi:predicted Zn-dependent protease
VIGAGRYRGGAFVTVSGLREFFGFRPDTGEYAMHQKSAIDAVELAVCHEVGHVLIESYGRSMENLREEWHCNHPQCLMQETSDIAHFVEHAVKARLNFCKECARRIRMEVETLRRDSEEYD